MMMKTRSKVFLDTNNSLKIIGKSLEGSNKISLRFLFEGKYWKC